MNQLANTIFSWGILVSLLILCILGEFCDFLSVQLCIKVDRPDKKYAKFGNDQ